MAKEASHPAKLSGLHIQALGGRAEGFSCSLIPSSSPGSYLVWPFVQFLELFPGPVEVAIKRNVFEHVQHFLSKDLTSGKLKSPYLFL